MTATDEGFSLFMEKVLKKRGSKKRTAVLRTKRRIYSDIEQSNPTGVSYKDFWKILDTVFLLFADSLLNGNDIRFPYNLGSINTVSRETNVKNVNGRLKIFKYIDWNATLKLWYSDPEAKKEKILVRTDQKNIYSICYRKKNASYNNKKYFRFLPARELKLKLRDKIREGGFDSFKEKDHGGTAY